MQHSELKKRVCGMIDEMAAELVGVSHEIHANPETAFQEVHAHKLLTDRLDAHGLNVTRGACGLDTAYISEFGTGAAQIGILSEYDALPGIGHACGHNIIASSGLGAALALAKLGDDLPGRIRYLGTPAEESGGGKELMARQHAFDGLEASMMIHPAGIDLVTMPSIAMSEVRVTYKGKSAHAAAMPHAGVNALDALVTAYQSLAQLRQHIRGNERIHGIFNEAGIAPNIVPDHAVGTFYVRAPDGVTLAELKKRVQNCFEAGALSTGCEVEVQWAQADYLEIKDAWSLADKYRANAESIGRHFFPLEKIPASGAGSTDMGNISHRMPSIHPMIACAPPNVVIHNPEFAKWAGSEKGDKAVLDGAKAMAMTAIEIVGDETLRAQAWDEFNATAEASAQAVNLAYNSAGDAALGGCGCC